MHDDDDLLPLHPTLKDPRTGEPLRAFYRTKRGELVWPVMGGSQPTGEPAQPAPAPTPPPPAPPAPVPAPPPAPAAAPPQPPAPPATGQSASSGKQYAAGPNGEDLGYPVNTPVAEMTAKEEAAYWRHKSRQHEDRWKSVQDYDDVKAKATQYDQLVATQQTDHERAVAAAREEGRSTALQEAGGQVVEAYVRAAATGRMSKEAVDSLLAHLDRARFIDKKTGAVDADKVYELVGSLAPAPTAQPVGAPAPTPGQAAGVPGAPVVPATVPTPAGGPDFGQGKPASARPSGLAAGAEIARARFGIKNDAQNTPA